MSNHHRASFRHSTLTSARKGARYACIGLVVAGFIIASTSLALASTSGIGSRPAAGAAHPRQVDLGLAQVVAPPSWTVEAELPCPIPSAKGSVLLVDVTPPPPKGCPPVASSSAQTIAWIFSSKDIGSGAPVRVIHGFDLYSASVRGAHGYLIPQLGIELLWSGAEPNALIASLGWSPLHDVLLHGAARTPSSWTRVSFDGVSIAAPASWPVHQPLRIACSGPFDNGPVVALGVKVIPLPCPYEAPPTRPTNGIIVSSTDQLSACPITGTLEVAGMQARFCSDPSVQPSELEVKLVFGSGSTKATVYVTVGLGGNGMVARELLGSVVGLVPLPV